MSAIRSLLNRFRSTDPMRDPLLTRTPERKDPISAEIDQLTAPRAPREAEQVNRVRERIESGLSQVRTTQHARTWRDRLSNLNGYSVTFAAAITALGAYLISRYYSDHRAWHENEIRLYQNDKIKVSKEYLNADCVRNIPYNAFRELIEFCDPFTGDSYARYKETISAMTHMCQNLFHQFCIADYRQTNEREAITKLNQGVVLLSFLVTGIAFTGLYYYCYCRSRMTPETERALERNLEEFRGLVATNQVHHQTDEIEHESELEIVIAREPLTFEDLIPSYEEARQILAQHDQESMVHSHFSLILDSRDIIRMILDYVDTNNVLGANFQETPKHIALPLLHSLFYNRIEAQRSHLLAIEDENRATHGMV